MDVGGLGAYVGVILKLMVEKYSGKAWTQFVWLSIGTGGRML